MNRGIVLDGAAIERLNWAMAAHESWLDGAEPGAPIEGLRQVVYDGFLYLIAGTEPQPTHLLVVANSMGSNFFSMPEHGRIECFQRLVKVGLSQIDRGVKLPADWRAFHSGSLISFQSNRFATKIRSRVYVDLSPEGTSHIFAYALEDNDAAALSREKYDADIFSDAVLNFEEAYRSKTSVDEYTGESGHISVALTRTFSGADVAQGIPFTVWRDSKLTKDQLQFFGAKFDGPLRLRGAAGTGKTLVLCLRFLKEIYERLDSNVPLRAAFLCHGQETADMVRAYLVHMDERGVLTQLEAAGGVQVTTLHGLANEFVNYDAEGVQPISLDGAEGRAMQFELMRSICDGYRADAKRFMNVPDSDFMRGLSSDSGSFISTAFVSDLIDEFSSVLEAFDVRDVDLIAEKYLKASLGGRVLTKSAQERVIVLELYRSFRKELSDLGVVSLDQFISDFTAYLNSFRWDSVRGRKGFDLVFADELHLFNRQERQVLGFLLRDAAGAMRVAVAYDPRQSPRNSFLPHDQAKKDAVWSEVNLSAGAKKFELTDVFRYTPEILAFLKKLNRHFPAEDLSEEWGLVFGDSMLPSGPKPSAVLADNNVQMANLVADEARKLLRKCKSGERVAVLALDHERFATYEKAGIFKAGFVSVGSRDDVGAIQRYSQRAVLSMPEYVAGLQFQHVLLIDANASLVATMGAGVNGVQKFVSAVYLGASRARETLKIVGDRSQGGFAQSIRDGVQDGVLQTE